MPLVPFYTPLKILENLLLSDVFRGYRKKPVAWNGLIHLRILFYGISMLADILKQCSDHVYPSQWIFTTNQLSGFNDGNIIAECPQAF